MTTCDYPAAAPEAALYVDPRGAYPTAVPDPDGKPQMPTLDWIGKSAVVNHHRQVPYRLLQCDTKLSAGDPDTGNPPGSSARAWSSDKCPTISR